VFWALAVILVAFAAFSAFVLARRPAGPTSHRLDLDQVRGFVYVGSATLVMLAAGVVVVGLMSTRSGRAEAIAVLGFFGYVLYLLAAVGVLWFLSRRQR
jgi:protein-S-isoprenylcysteine O-methyltransferase Ste14